MEAIIINRIRLALVVTLALLAGCYRAPLHLDLVPDAFSMYKRGLPDAVDVEPVTGYNAETDKSGQKISNEVLRDALRDSLIKSRLFSNVTCDDHLSRYGLKAEIIYQGMVPGFNSLPLEMHIRYLLFDRIKGSPVWNQEIVSHSGSEWQVISYQRVCRSNILRLVQELSNLNYQ